MNKKKAILGLILFALGVLGKGLPLLDKIKDRTIFRLLKTKIFGSGAIVLYYEPTRQ